ncbi:MAG: maleylpyruvate isomerase N-terminal domain-containing protein [Egibacteraceae bacterium]
MISMSLARRLRDAGLVWHPTDGDRFWIPDRNLDESIFTISAMTVDVRDVPGGRLIAFNGTVEWALDAIMQQEAVWLPSEPRMRELLGAHFADLSRVGDRYRCQILIGDERTGFEHADPAEAYGLALLSWLAPETIVGVAPIVERFLHASRQAVQLIQRDEVRDRWEEPSALDGYSIGALAGHLARAALTVEQYLSAPEAPDATELLDAPAYFSAALVAHDPVHSDFHRAVRARGEEVGRPGALSLASELDALIGPLGERLRETALQQRITVLGGAVMTVEEYLKTRLVELVIHTDDLASSAGLDATAFVTDDAAREVAAILGAIAADRAGGLAVVRSLARRERAPEAVRAL